MAAMNNLESKQINVGRAHFGWEPGKGSFLFEGEDAILFWINSAFKTFLDTIEEVSGDESASVVLETTGYRMGLIVGEFFYNEEASPEEVIQMLPGIYSSAGWGTLDIVHFCQNEKKAVLRMTNSWEYRINKLQGKKEHGTFIPGHWAGVLSGLFGENIWYRVMSSQLEGKDFCEFEYFPSSITVNENIHELARRKEQVEIHKLETVVHERTRELSDLIKEISSPIIPVLDHIVVIPLLGKYNEERSTELLEKTIHELPNYDPDFLILDVTGLDEEISELTVSLFHQLIAATSLLGIKTIMVGISPGLSMKMTQSNYQTAEIKYFANLKHGIHYALGEKGKRII
ncbi:Anti-anti-sigma regulatory factor (antagonist of anti-sigma factor) [Fictibacillus enclensis]|nr:Anti-anti-sigma regulatory factor (antagonist of anti-sigma factor) [Fictibacillus enclensis]